MSRLSNFITAALNEGRDPEEIADTLHCSIEDVERHMVDTAMVDTSPLTITQTGEIVYSGSFRYRGSDFRDAIAGTNQLQTDLRITAGCALRALQDKLSNDLSCKELSMVATAVSTIQNSFFAKPTTVIANVNGEGGTSQTLLSSLRNRMQP